jgi:hypothetical protein
VNSRFFKPCASPEAPAKMSCNWQTGIQVFEIQKIDPSEFCVFGKIKAENMCWGKPEERSIGTVVVLPEVRLCAAGRRKVSDR